MERKIVIVTLGILCIGTILLALIPASISSARLDPTWRLGDFITLRIKKR